MAWFNIAWVRATLVRLTIRNVMAVNSCSAIVYVRCHVVSAGDDCYPVLNQVRFSVAQRDFSCLSGGSDQNTSQVALHGPAWKSEWSKVA